MRRAVVLGLFGALACSAIHRGHEAVTTVPVFVHEKPDTVELAIHLPPGSDPGSVEVQLDERAVTVLAEDASGRPIRSETIHLTTPAVETETTADYEGDGWLTVTLRRGPP